MDEVSMSCSASIPCSVSPPRMAAVTSRRWLPSLCFTTVYWPGPHTNRSNIRPDRAGSAVSPEDQRISPSWPVDELAGNLEVGQKLANATHVVAHLLREERGIGPCARQQLGRGEEPLWVVEQKLQELELAIGQAGLLPAMADRGSFGVEPQSLKLPQATVPEVEPDLVAMHLTLDDGQVRRRGFLRHRLQ